VELREVPEPAPECNIVVGPELRAFLAREALQLADAVERLLLVVAPAQAGRDFVIEVLGKVR
jgi:hypothetical protein